MIFLLYENLLKTQILATQSFYVHTFLWWLNDNNPLVYCVHVDNIAFCLGFIYYYSTEYMKLKQAGEFFLSFGQYATLTTASILC